MSETQEGRGPEGVPTSIDFAKDPGNVEKSIGTQTVWGNLRNDGDVLLLPQFCYMVISKSYDKENKVIKVKVTQVPYQEQLKLREIEQSQIIWIDPKVRDDPKE